MRQEGSRFATRVLLLVFFAMILLISPGSLSTCGAEENRSQIKLNMSGSDVAYLQDCLYQIGYLKAPIDGVFGSATQTAVLNLQRDAGLRADGIVGRATWQVVEDMINPVPSIYVVQPGETLWSIAKQLETTVSALVDANGIRNPDRLGVGDELVVPLTRAGSKSASASSIRLMHWDDVKRLFVKGQRATVHDLKSGLRFQVRRLFGTNHADVEPLTVADTRTMKKAIGGKWSWNRRPIVVEIGGYRIAASMNGFPHAQSTIDNGFPGHFCIHFLGSRLHVGNRVDKDHQAAVLQAAGYGGDMDKVSASR